jgi:hypothetical protein
MVLQIVPVNVPLTVEGRGEVVGEFRGRVIAIAMSGSDPVADAGLDNAPPSDEEGGPEGLLGWGSTYLLVCDDRRPAPVWVAKSDLDSHSLDDVR